MGEDMTVIETALLVQEVEALREKARKESKTAADAFNAYDVRLGERSHGLALAYHRAADRLSLLIKGQAGKVKADQNVPEARDPQTYRPSLFTVVAEGEYDEETDTLALRHIPPASSEPADR